MSFDLRPYNLRFFGVLGARNSPIIFRCRLRIHHLHDIKPTEDPNKIQKTKVSVVASQKVTVQLLHNTQNDYFLMPDRDKSLTVKTNVSRQKRTRDHQRIMVLLIPSSRLRIAEVLEKASTEELSARKEGGTSEFLSAHVQINKSLMRQRRSPVTSGSAPVRWRRKAILSCPQCISDPTIRALRKLVTQPVTTLSHGSWDELIFLHGKSCFPVFPPTVVRHSSLQSSSVLTLNLSVSPATKSILSERISRKVTKLRVTQEWTTNRITIACIAFVVLALGLTIINTALIS